MKIIKIGKCNRKIKFKLKYIPHTTYFCLFVVMKKITKLNDYENESDLS